MSEYNHGWWHSADGLRLHYRDYPGDGDSPASGDGRPAVLCLHGLTRNARDFAGLAAHLSSRQGGGWRVICAEMRGRGLSAYAPDAMSYTPAQYVGDVLALLDQAGIQRVVVVGTSMGGIMAMVLGLLAPARLAGAVLNEPSGRALTMRPVGTAANEKQPPRAVSRRWYLRAPEAG